MTGTTLMIERILVAQIKAMTRIALIRLRIATNPTTRGIKTRIYCLKNDFPIYALRTISKIKFIIICWILIDQFDC